MSTPNRSRSSAVQNPLRMMGSGGVYRVPYRRGHIASGVVAPDTISEYSSAISELQPRDRAAAVYDQHLVQALDRPVLELSLALDQVAVPVGEIEHHALSLPLCDLVPHLAPDAAYRLRRPRRVAVEDPALDLEVRIGLARFGGLAVARSLLDLVPGLRQCVGRLILELERADDVWLILALGNLRLVAAGPGVRVGLAAGAGAP